MMMLRRLWPVLLGVLFTAACADSGPVRAYQGSLPAGQVATVSVPAALEVRAVDGRPVDAPASPVGRYRLELAPGPHVLEVLYKEVWGSTLDHVVVVSDAVQLRFDARPGAVYRMDFAAPGTQQEAEALVHDLQVWLESGDTRIASSPIPGDRTGSHPLRSLGLGGAVAAAPAPPPAAGPAPAPAAPPAGGGGAEQAERVISQQDALQRLKLWWKLADPEERRAFRAWIEQGGE